VAVGARKLILDIARDKSMSDKKQDEGKERETDSYIRELIEIYSPSTLGSITGK
jgi:hypothetical protein